LANPWQEDPGAPVDATAKPDLSRLMHPLLEQNLDKLAEVYLTNPPEERDKAIAELLRELQQNTPPGTAPLTAAAPAMGKASPSCPACHRQSRAEQRFCGFCGAPLYVDTPPAPEPPPDYSYPEESGGFLGLSSLPSEPAEFDNDVQFLRDRTFGGVYATEETSHSGWKYLIAVAVILLLAGLGYREWTIMGRPQSISQVVGSGQPAASRAASSAPSSRPPSSAAQTPASTSASSSPAPSAAPSAASGQDSLSETDLPGPTEPAAAAPAEQTPAPEPAAAAPSAAPAPVAPERKPAATRPVNLASDNQANSEASAPAPANGSQELALAQRYLSQHETTLAAEWLWKSVSKQNGQAALLLADLYTRGDGVPQSCEQARMLLVAAAKRGTAGAGMQLRTIESTCR